MHDFLEGNDEIYFNNIDYEFTNNSFCLSLLLCNHSSSCRACRYAEGRCKSKWQAS